VIAFREQSGPKLEADQSLSFHGRTEAKYTQSLSSFHDHIIVMYHISPNIRPVLLQYCVLEERGRFIFGYLRINMKKRIIMTYN
jgi:hypothetical protein